MKRRKKRGLPRYLYVWATITILAFGYVMATKQSNQAFETKNDKEDLASQAQAASPAIPPIDKGVPAIIETASFGLG